MIRSRVMTIAFKEGMKLSQGVSDQLVAASQSDIRQIINILSTWKLSSSTMSFDESQKLYALLFAAFACVKAVLTHLPAYSADQRDPNALATPFVLMDRLFGPQAWSQTKPTRIQDKLEIYFSDFDLLPLWVQENYLKHKYNRANNLSNPKQTAYKKMEITAKAADAISDGDLVDRMIHG